MRLVTFYRVKGRRLMSVNDLGHSDESLNTEREKINLLQYAIPLSIPFPQRTSCINNEDDVCLEPLSTIV